MAEKLDPTPLLDNYEVALDNVEESAESGQVARNWIAAINLLKAANEALPEALRTEALPSEDEVERVKAVAVPPFNNPDLQAMVARVKNLIGLGAEFLGEELFGRASTLDARYASVATKFGSGAGERSTSGEGDKYVQQAIRIVMPDGKPRHANNGYWGNLRYQLRVFASVLTGLPKDDAFAKSELDPVIGLLRAVDEGKSEVVDLAIHDAMGNEYRVQYPAFKVPVVAAS